LEDEEEAMLQTIGWESTGFSPTTLSTGTTAAQQAK
jgi:hypothetical protein